MKLQAGDRVVVLNSDNGTSYDGTVTQVDRDDLNLPWYITPDDESVTAYRWFNPRGEVGYLHVTHVNGEPA